MTTYRERHLAGLHSGNGEAAQVEEPQPQVVEKPQDEEQQDEGAEGFFCEICGQTFDTQHGLAVHRGKVHANEEIPA